MWTTLKYGEKPSVGDTIRFHKNDSGVENHEGNWLVFRVDQHFFEIIRKSGHLEVNEAPKPERVRYADIGYNVILDRWVVPQEV